ncbi:MAG: hypothetical protein IKQ41_11740 [Clostridia bacterium]|nr:hypothetical protein [Clostridia bacterium]
MITMRFSGRTPTPGAVSVGMETDQKAEKMRFVLPQVSDSQTAQLCMMLPDNSPEVLNIQEGLATLPASVTAVPGRIRAWVEILGANTVAWNSEIFYMDVGDLPPISETVERTFPTLLMEALAEAEKAKSAAKAAREAMEILMAYGKIVHISVENETLNINSAMLGSEGAYELAVLNGYEGTEEEWDAYMDTMESGSWSTELEEALSQVTALANTALTTAQGKSKVKHASLTIESTDWIGAAAPYTASKACAAVNAADQLIVGVGEDTGGNDAREIAKAQISCVAQSDGSVTFRALGTKPSVAIDVNIIALEE